MAAARGLELVIYEHLHTNNKPRQQTSPLTTRCDTTKTGPHFSHCRGHYSSNTPACTRYKSDLIGNRNCVFPNSWNNAHLLDTACIFGTRWTTKNAKKPKGNYTNILESYRFVVCEWMCVCVNVYLFEINLCVCKGQTCVYWKTTWIAVKLLKCKSDIQTLGYLYTPHPPDPHQETPGKQEPLEKIYQITHPNGLCLSVFFNWCSIGVHFIQTFHTLQL